MKKRITTRSAKNKGMLLQKEICKLLADFFNEPFDNQNDHCLLHSRESGQSGTDIIMRGEIYKKFLFDIECKRTEKPNIYKAVNQAKANTTEGRHWLVVHKKNYTEPIFIMDWEGLSWLMQKAGLND